jgi:hypothetical protein
MKNITRRGFVKRSSHCAAGRFAFGARLQFERARS